MEKAFHSDRRLARACEEAGMKATTSCAVGDLSSMARNLAGEYGGCPDLRSTSTAIPRRIHGRDVMGVVAVGNHPEELLPGERPADESRRISFGTRTRLRYAPRGCADDRNRDPQMFNPDSGREARERTHRRRRAAQSTAPTVAAIPEDAEDESPTWMPFPRSTGQRSGPRIRSTSSTRRLIAAQTLTGPTAPTKRRSISPERS